MLCTMFQGIWPLTGEAVCSHPVCHEMQYWLRKFLD